MIPGVDSNPLNARRRLEILDEIDSVAVLDGESQPVCKVTRGEGNTMVFTFRTFILTVKADGSFFMQNTPPDPWGQRKLALIRDRRRAKADRNEDSSLLAAKEWVERNFPEYRKKPD